MVSSSLFMFEWTDCCPWHGLPSSPLNHDDGGLSEKQRYCDRVTCGGRISCAGVGVSNEGAGDVRRGEGISCAYRACILDSLLQNDNRVRAQFFGPPSAKCDNPS